jgi:hypothetical protein
MRTGRRNGGNRRRPFRARDSAVPPADQPDGVQAAAFADLDFVGAVHDVAEAELALHPVAQAHLVDVLTDRGAGFGGA